MKPRRTVHSNFVFHLAGGNEDNDLWAEVTQDPDEHTVIRSVWQPSDDERQAIAEGANVELLVWGKSHPAVAVGVNSEALGRPRPADEEGSTA